MKNIWDIGISIILFLQGLGGWLAAPMKLITFLGKVEFYLVLMPALYWCWDMRLGLRTGVLLMLSGGLNDVLKIAFHQPRPFWVDQRVQPLSVETNFGFPSGHAQNGIAVWGLIAHALRRRWAWPVALVLAILISLSRAYLGVHFPHSLLLGWLVGALLLWAFLRWESPVSRWLKERSLGQQVLVAFFASLALLGLSALSLLSLGDWQVPASWAQAALASTGEPIDPLTPKYAFTSAGVLFGMGAGAAWLVRAGGFRSDGPAGKRLTRYVLGMVGLLGLWFGLGEVLPHDPSLLALVLRYVTAALAGVWVSAAAPALFLRLNLAEEAGESGS
jgi:membrane-associated phospholipid phosphatase